MKAIVSVIGQDKKGIIAKVTHTLFKLDINVEDISQTILQGHFTMIMVVSLDECKKHIEDIAIELNKVANEIGVTIQIQRDSIFNSMHNI